MVSEAVTLDKNKVHDIEIIVDRLVLKADPTKEDKSRLADSIEAALGLGEGTIYMMNMDTSKEERS